ncbi:MAG: hypothetical protein JNJ45_06900 [Chthonomonas sp.]|nr:hypothetical protein [Chthonomonas sp.]
MGSSERKLKLGCIVIPLGILIAFSIIWSRFQWIPAGYVGVIYNASGGLQDKVYTPRRVFVNWFQTLYVYPTRLQAAIYSSTPQWGEVSASDGIQITTSDQATTTFDVAVYYRIRKENVFTAFKSFGAIPIEDVQSQHIRRAVREAANAVGTQYDVFQLLGDKRQEASERINERLVANLGRKGVTIERTMLMTATSQADITQKITTRVNSLTQLTISRLLSQIAEVSRQSGVVRAQSDVKARTLTASQTKDKSLQLMELELQEEAIDAWNGKLPRIQSKPGQTIVLGADALSSLQGGK